MNFLTQQLHLPAGVIEIDLLDNLEAVRTRCLFGDAIFERWQSPVVSIFEDTALLLELGVEPVGVKVGFRGVYTEWIPGSGVFPPTLDSYILASAVVDSRGTGECTVWDVGCGTGVIGLYLASCPFYTEVLMSDIQPEAVAQARHNADRLARQIHTSTLITFRAESFPSPNDKLYDVLASNPPYFRTSCWGGSIFDGQATDRTMLTESLIREGLRQAKRVVFTFSSTETEHIRPILEEVEPEGAKSRILAKRRLPLPQQYHPLVAPPGVFVQGPIERYELWHDVSVCELSSEFTSQ